MGKLFDTLCEEIEKVNPNFDRNNSEDIDIMTKCFLLSMSEKPIYEEMKKDYMETVVEGGQKEKLKKMIAEKGHQIVKYELGKLNLEKEILERRIEITKKYLD